MNFTSTGIVREHSRRTVAYYYDEGIGNFYYGAGHVMKPHRIKLTHHLLMAMNMYRHLEAYKPTPASVEELCRFHSYDYIDFLQTVDADTVKNSELERYNCYDDCPIFDGIFKFCQMSSGGSIAAAMKLNKKQSEISINWMGGLHHAKKTGASGFCYTNDIVLAILELLKRHARVLYIDIDVHHGDGVEEAFLLSHRVMCVSFHKYGDFFPGTGDITDIGVGAGLYNTINVPLLEGCSNSSFHKVFKPIMKKVMERFDPEAIVLQCGADSLSGDRLGPFNLSPEGHGECVSFLRKYNVPLLLLGGGGYTPRNVARCWAYETSLALNREIGNTIPDHAFSEYYLPNFNLRYDPEPNVVDLNTPAYLRSIKTKIFKNIACLPFSPSVQMQPLLDDRFPHFNDRSFAADIANPDVRLPSAVMDGVVEHEGEYYDGEQDGDARKNQHNAKPRKKTAAVKAPKKSKAPKAIVKNEPIEESLDQLTGKMHLFTYGEPSQTCVDVQAKKKRGGKIIKAETPSHGVGGEPGMNRSAMEVDATSAIPVVRSVETVTKEEWNDSTDETAPHNESV